MTVKTHSYVAYGLAIRSELALPELLEAHAPADVEIRLGHVDRTTPEGAVQGMAFWATDGLCCISDDRGGAFLVRGGREITVDQLPGADPATVRVPLIGLALPVVLHQRGLLALHASGVAISGKAVAFLGAPRQGKSTTAAALHARGHELVSDDIIAVDVSGDEPTVYPAFPLFKLWPESVASVGEDPDDLPRLRPDVEKRARRIADGFWSEPLPLGRIYVIGEGETCEIARLRPGEAIVELIGHSYCAPLLPAQGATRHLMQCTKVVNRVPVLRLQRPLSIGRLPELAKIVEEDVVGVTA